MKAFELQLLTWFDKYCIISAFDKAQINTGSREIAVVPNGVDTDYFTPENQPKKYDLLFIGNLSYLPNKNAVNYLVTEILPLLLKQRPDISINIAGADTPPDIFKLAGANVHISGFVPDIRDVYSSARIFVAPLFTGAGLQNKILEAMSMQLPCITTSVVNGSLNAIDQQQILIANDATEFAKQILNLLAHEMLQTTLRNEARIFVQQSYSWETANETLRHLL
jgi:glycosyltransferase involved in cell wall biosynthesis